MAGHLVRKTHTAIMGKVSVLWLSVLYCCSKCMCLCVQTLVFLKLSSNSICTTEKVSGVLIDILVVLSQELFYSVNGQGHVQV